MCKYTTKIQYYNTFPTIFRQFFNMNTTDKYTMLNDAYEKALSMGLVKNKSEFADLVGVNRSGLSCALNGSEKYLTDSLIAKVSAAMNRELTRVTISQSPHSNVATGNSTITISSPEGEKQDITEDMIPVIPTNIYKESDVNIVEYINDEDNDVQMTPAVQQFPKTTCFYSVQTMAMYPHFHQGDILALKVIRRQAPIVNGEVYAVDTKDLGILIRFVYDRGDSIEMRNSEQTNRFESFLIKKEDIYNIFRVVGMIRTNI